MGRYDDIIGMAHPVSRKHKPMPTANRAAQFAPFAALVGYEDAVAETARLTQPRRENGEWKQLELDMKLRVLLENIHGHPWIRVTHFEKDASKAGGRYAVSEGRVKKIRLSEADVVLENGECIALENLMDIESTLFDSLCF